MRGFEAQQHRQPAAPAVALDQGRLTALEALQIAGVAIAALFVATLGGSIAWVARPDELGGFAAGGLSFWFWLFGNLVSLTGLAIAGSVLYLSIRSWLRYDQRVQDWHIAALDAYEGSDGQEVTTAVRAFELTASDPRDLLLFALSIQSDYMRGKDNAHSVRAVQGARWIASESGQQTRIGDVTATQAEALTRQLASLGMIEGRAARSAGTWKPQSYEEVIRIYAEKQRSRGQPPPA